ncbi:MAG: glycosyltransferase [Halarcobacter sp.]
MKKSNPLVSVIITTYNRYSLLKFALKELAKQTYKNLEIIVSDDCSSDNTKEIKNDFPFIKYIKNTKQSGYLLNAKYALSYVTGDYVIFATDDDLFGNKFFIEKSIDMFKSDRNIDMIFSRVEIIYGKTKILNKFPFKNCYTREGFFDNFEELNLNFDDYYVLSSIVFKKEKLDLINPFNSIFENSATIDSSIIFRYVSICEKIAFLDLVGYRWNRPIENSLSNSNRNDLVKQAKFNLVFPFDVDSFVDKLDNIDLGLKKKIKSIMSKRVEYVFQAVLSEKERLNNQTNFKNLVNKLDLNNTIYIYGRGWTGLELKNFFYENKITDFIFVDDYKVGFDDTMGFDEFKSIGSYKQTVITSYKYKDIYNIYRKLNKLNNIEIYDLLGTDE